MSICVCMLWCAQLQSKLQLSLHSLWMCMLWMCMLSMFPARCMTEQLSSNADDGLKADEGLSLFQTRHLGQSIEFHAGVGVAT